MDQATCDRFITGWVVQEMALTSTGIYTYTPFRIKVQLKSLKRDTAHKPSSYKIITYAISRYLLLLTIERR
jgi:hypothetical protein